jgi:ABC-type transport system involved in multi-copper enzyme maturation permease subunit
MQREETMKDGILPIFNTIIFEIKMQRKKFYFFFLITILVVVLMGYILVLIPSNLLADTYVDFFSTGLGFISFITLFAACLFFSGIICSEFDKKTGFIVFPKINKYKLILGKYLGNLILVVSIVAIYYFLLALFGIWYYGPVLNIRIFYSFGFAVLYVIMLSSFVTFFSSFLKNVNVTIILTLIILLIGFNIADSFVTLFLKDAFEPLYSLSYLSNLITSILENPFPDPRYVEFSFGGMGPGGMGGDFTIGTWLTPSIEMGITLFVVYIVVFFVLAAYLFKRRQL